MATMAATMPLAIMTTLAHRLPMLIGAMGDPKAFADPELTRMVEEKVQAGVQVAESLGKSAIAGQQAMAAYAMEQAVANLALSTELASRTPDRWQHPIQTHGNRALHRMAALAERIGEIGSKGLSGSMKPAHSRVVANARRLGNKTG